jgi:hypothetical protein
VNIVHSPGTAHKPVAASIDRRHGRPRRVCQGSGRRPATLATESRLVLHARSEFSLRPRRVVMRRGTLVLAAMLVLGTSGAAFAESHAEKKQPSCDDIQAKWEMGGGTDSEDMVAKKMNVPVERVRECLKKDAAEQKGADAPAKSK